MAKTDKAVRLMKAVKVAGRWRWCRLASDAKGRSQPDVVLVNGHRQTHRDGRYAVFWKESGKNCSEPAGKDFAEAQATLRRRKARLNAQLAGVKIPEEPSEKDRIRLEDAAYDFLTEVKTQRKPKTYSAHRGMLNDFLASCGKTYLDQIERRDLIEFVAYLKRERKLEDRTIYNKFALLISFLKANGIRGLVTKKDWPKYTQKDVEVYEAAELVRLFGQCDDAQRLRYQFFLSSAGREQEVVFTAWPDLDVRNGLWHVKAKPDHGFKPKDYEERTVPLPDELVQQLKRRRKHDPNGYFVFSNAQGKPDGHMLRTLKEIALAAGLNCGHCKNAEGLTCKRHPVCERWYLHKFRATTATNWLQNGVDIKTVQSWLGHSDMESTLRYLKAAAARAPIVRDKVNATFAGLTK